MLKIYLARHGQDEDNAHGILNGHRDQPLTAVGLNQATQVAQKIKKAGLFFDAIYSSPLQRAYKTAEIISTGLGLPKPIKLDDLIERDFGIMTGKTTADIIPMCQPHLIYTDTITYFNDPSGAESFPQMVERAARLLHFIKEKHLNGSVLLVTHGDCGKMVYAAYYKLDWKEVLTLFHFGNSELLLLSADSSPEEAHVFKIEQHNL